MNDAVGSGADVRTFFTTAIQAHGGIVSGDDPYVFDISDVPRDVHDALGPVAASSSFTGRFEMPVPAGQLYLSRTHPVVGGLAAHVLDRALDASIPSEARRCGVIRTDGVERRTTLLLCRIRIRLVAEQRDGEFPMLAEDAVVLGFTGTAEQPRWLDASDADELLLAGPTGNVDPDVAAEMIGEVLAAEETWRPHLDDEANARAAALVASHERVREADARRGVGRRAHHRAEPQLPVDVLGVYVYLPAVNR